MNIFRERVLPEPGEPVGYAHLIDRFDLRVPLPPRLAVIANRHHPQSTAEWQLLTPRHAPDESLAGHLEFAIKWEGVRLEILDAVFAVAPADEMASIVRAKPTGKYSRRLWFLYEWLTGRQLDVPDAGKIKSTPVLDPELQFAVNGGEPSVRHRVTNNLPGSRAFCPLVWRTPVLTANMEKGLDSRARDLIGRTHSEVTARAAAYLLLGDSRASFQIEREKPSPQRAARWARAIGEAGSRPLSIEELERLQRIVIGDDRFVHLGLRTQGGFVGLHDRVTGEPIPDHISARHDDLAELLNGLIVFSERTLGGGMDAASTMHRCNASV